MCVHARDECGKDHDLDLTPVPLIRRWSYIVVVAAVANRQVDNQVAALIAVYVDLSR